jgi:hypothetical protein
LTWRCPIVGMKPCRLLARSGGLQMLLALSAMKRHP